MFLQRLVLITCLLVVSTAECVGQSFYLKEDASGAVHGPFDCKDGAKVKLSDASFTVMRLLAVKPTLAQKLKKAVVPEVDFRNVRLSDVVNFLRQASVDYSPPAEEKYKGVNLILLLRGRPEPMVTFRAQELSIEEILEAIVSVTGFRMRVQGNVVYVEPKP